MKKNPFRALFALSILIGVLAVFAACSTTKTVSATVDKNAATVEVSEDLYGLFLEDISFAGDGGLFPMTKKLHLYLRLHIDIITRASV